MGVVREFGRDAADMFISAGRMLVRHWPVLLALSLAGMAFRGAALWTAVEVSDQVNWLGHGLVILAPLGFLLAMIAMLRVLRQDLPNTARAGSATAPADATTGRERRLIDVTTSMVVPFFAVYVSAGLLTHDVAQFLNEAGADEINQVDFYGTGDGPDFSRVFINSITLVVGLVLVAWVLRFALGRAEKRWSFLGFAVLGALVEVYWSANVAGYIDGQKAAAWNWLQTRVVVARTTELYDTALDRMGPLGEPAKVATTWLSELLGVVDSVIIVPLAWITVGAVVLGHKLAPAPKLEHPWLTRANAIPKPVVRSVAGLTEDVASRFSAFFAGLRLMARAGLVPMLLFGLAALLALRVPYLVSAVWRLVVGPVPGDTYVAWAPIEGAIADAVMMTVLAALLAAGVDRMLSRVNPVAPQGSPDLPTTAEPA
ncbi:hypothetical protein VST63_20645 [Mycolicibacterium sp. 050232]|uniref:hypothetical protein n=1 Tax=Mycolicibacterium sp. 050232 TaxID=3113982 RepID=UPI002E2C5DEB|nr:hypothetical protein [Mycolicibacterium sp. 050232]MED5814776.1 hypothetical protein [Mycolicibacterium sp. 050232]